MYEKWKHEPLWHPPCAFSYVPYCFVSGATGEHARGKQGWASPHLLTHPITSGSFQVSAYGFITENYRKFSDHYYEHEKKPLVFYANHDMLLESELWKSLHRVGIMKLYQQWHERSLSCSTGVLCLSLCSSWVELIPDGYKYEVP